MWWGVTVLAIGTISAVLGVLYALMQHDLKRLLAYHSIENIGIILMGFGAALMFLNTGHPLLATLALIAGLYHTINHAVFKGLLFLGAGAVLHATHTRDMEQMGGLAKRMPQTAFFFLVGAVAISALPPLNGFVSEWLTYQSLLQGFGSTDSLLRLIFPIGGALLALTGALAAACFVKAFGITFLAQPRSEPAAQAHEAPLPMLLGQGRPRGRLRVSRPCAQLFSSVLEPVDATITGLQISPQLTRGQRAGAVRRQPAWRHGLDPRHCGARRCFAVQFFFFLMAGPLGKRRKPASRPDWDCGLQGSDPAHGIHRHRFLQAHPDDFQGAVPSAPRSAAGIRLFALLRHEHPFRGPTSRKSLRPGFTVRCNGRCAPVAADARAAGRQPPGVSHLYFHHLVAAAVVYDMKS